MSHIRAITNDEQTKLRSDFQWGSYGLAIQEPPARFTATTAAETSNDQVLVLSYTTVSGSYTNVLAGMSVWVGSTAGACDLGIVRVRKAPTASLFYIGATSDIDWSITRYLTVYDEFLPWARNWRAINNEFENIQMDGDIVYSDQYTNFDPVVTLGPDRVLYGDWSTFLPTVSPDSSNSWVFGSTIDDVFAWTATGTGTTIADPTTSHPTITFPGAGQFRFSCTAGAANGKSATGHRTVFVYDAAHPPLTDFSVQNISGALSSGGWSYDVTLYGEYDITTIRDRAKCILFAIDENYGASRGSIGPITGYENIVCTGWIDGSTIQTNPTAGGSVTFTVKGAAMWLDKIFGLSPGLMFTADAPTNWLYCQNLTTPIAVWNVLHWHANIDTICDVNIEASAQLVPIGDAPEGSIWSQVTTIAKKQLMQAAFDRYGQFHCYTNPQYLPVASRTAIPLVRTLTTNDWIPPMNLEYVAQPKSARADCLGFGYDGSDPIPYISRAPGHAPKRTGENGPELDGLIVADQAALNAIAGLHLGVLNNPYPNIPVRMPEIDRFIDIWPPQYLAMDLDTTDSLGRINWSGKKMLPRSITITLDNAAGTWIQDVVCEGETFPEPSVTINVETPEVPNVEPTPITSLYALTPGITKSFPPVVQPQDDGSYDNIRYLCDCMTKISGSDVALYKHVGGVGVTPTQDHSNTTLFPTGGDIPSYDANTWYLRPGESTPMLTYPEGIIFGIRPPDWGETRVQFGFNGNWITMYSLFAGAFSGYWNDPSEYTFQLNLNIDGIGVIEIPLTYWTGARWPGDITSGWEGYIRGGFSRPTTVTGVQFKYLAGPDPDLPYPNGFFAKIGAFEIRNVCNLAVC